MDINPSQFDGQGDHHTPKSYVRQAFRKYLECGRLNHGFARARCDDCGRAASGDYFVAYSCKGRGVCPSCNTRRMVETAAHLSDHVFARQQVRQWVLSVPKRLRYFMQRCVPPKCSPAHYLWAVLIARIYEAFPLLCPVCGGQMWLIAFITHSADIR